ncbi:hypothetical protein [Rhodopirellula bahusiensis]|uniref:hypothetical protein n=7 Tax=Rhodopirellula bahusiensis TaxID=2014065 RepID=UPI003264AEDA
MASADWLRHVDYLSTVSGGGYTGSFLGRLFDQQRSLDDSGGEGVVQDRVRATLSDPFSSQVDWLRRHSNYLSPTGFGELMFNFAAFWRNFLSLQVVVAIFFLGVFGLGNAIAYWLLPVVDPQPPLVTPLVPVSTALLGMNNSLWFMLAELSVWTMTLPLALAYWLVSQDDHETFVLPALLGGVLVSGAMLVAFAQPIGLVVFVAAVAWVVVTWIGVQKDDGHGDPYAAYRLGLARNRLTYRLAFWTTTLVALVLIGFVDIVGRWLASTTLFSTDAFGDLKLELSVITAALLAGAPIVRGLAGLVARKDESRGVLSSLGRIPYLPTVLAFLVAAGLPILVIAWISHLSFQVGYGVKLGFATTGLAWTLSFLLGRQSALPFVNRVGPLTIYAARLARVFLGAVNPRRNKSRSGTSVTQVIEGDDVGIAQYAPEAGSGPLHLINVACNETVDVASQRGMRDRQAENMAIGPVGINLSKRWHALWRHDSQKRQSSDLIPLGNSNLPHPFRRRDGQPASVENLTLRQWMAISGAAVSPGMGRLTSPAVSLLLTLANVRLGYWWNSGIWSGDRAELPMKQGLFAWLKNWFMRTFAAQGLLLSELRGQFAGPWRRHFYLSDGGNFENTATYELLRRRVPLIVTCDAGRDVKQQLSGLAELTRIARVDFGAEVTFVKDAMNSPRPEACDCVPDEIWECIGTIDSLTTKPSEIPDRPAFSDHHFTLLRVDYPAPPPMDAHDQPSAWHQRKTSWLLYIKSTTTGDEPVDIRNYQARNPDFPNESTLDQYFDEPQFESYRRLGMHIGEKVFAKLDGQTRNGDAQ